MAGAHPVPLASERRREAPVAERLAPHELRVADLLERPRRRARGVQAGDDRADAAAGHPVDVQPGVLELAQHPDVGEGAGAAAGQHQPERPAGEPVGQRPQAAAEVAVDDGQLPGVGGRHPGHPLLGRRVPARPAPGRAAGPGPGDRRRGRRRRRRGRRAPRRPPGAGRSPARRHPGAVAGRRRRRAAPGRGRARPAPARRGRPRPGATTDRCVRQPACRARRRPRRRRCPGAGRRRPRPRPARVARGRGARRPAVRSRSATWPSTNRAAAGSVASTSSKASRGISSTVESRRARTAGRARLAGQQRELAEHLRRAELAHHRPSTSTSRRPVRTTYADPGGSPSRISHVAGRRRSTHPGGAPRAGAGRRSGSAASSGSVGEVGRRPRRGRRRDRPARPAGRQAHDGAGRSSATSSVVGRRRAAGPAAARARRRRGTRTIDSTQPSWKAATAVAGVGSPRITTSIAMPSTPPSWRALDTTADAVAYRPPGPRRAPRCRAAAAWRRRRCR